MECTACHNAIEDGAAYCPECGARVVGAPEQDDYEYAAFISYRHRSPDREVAAWLHGKLESYRLPASAAQRYGSRKLGRVFRDEEELSATGSLPDSIREALARSRTLVVVCSPTTGESPWVTREIELFAALHGRNRIFAVLAEGKSAESIPAQIRSVMQIDGTGTAKPVDTEPLAADLRPGAKGKRSREALRVIAAIAGCPFDELARRDRARKARLTCTLAAACILVAAGIGFLGFKAEHARHDALVAGAAQLAAQSREELSHGNRYEAIELALEAVDKTVDAPNGEAADEAVAALESALGVDPSRTSPWAPAYSLNTRTAVSVIGEASMAHRTDASDLTGVATIGSIALSDDGASFAVADDSAQVSIYDTRTGRVLAVCEAPKPTGGQTALGDIPNRTPTTLAACASSFAIAWAGALGTFECVDARTGNALWTADDMAPASVSCSADASAVAGVALAEDGTVTTELVDVKSGQAMAHSTYSLDRPLTGAYGLKSAVDERDGSIFLAADGTLARLQAGSHDAAIATLAHPEIAAIATLAHPEIAAIAFQANTVLAATVEEYDGEQLELAYAVEAFDRKIGNRLWALEGTLASEMLQSEGYTALVLGWPQFRGLTADGQAHLVSAGKSLMALSVETGEVLFRQDFASTVVAALPVSLADQAPNCSFVLCADGSIALVDLDGAKVVTAVDEYRFNMGEPLRWGTFALLDDRLIALAASAETDSRIVAYQVDLSGTDTADEADREPNLDELAAQAHKILDEARG